MKGNMVAYVYCLYDKKSGIVFYVGSTKMQPSIRLSGHVSSVNNGGVLMYSWIRDNNVDFDMQILEELSVGTSRDVLDAEKRWIKKYISQGVELKNKHFVKEKTDYNLLIKLTDEEVVKTAKKICVDLPLTLGEYVTEAVKEKNLKSKKP